MTSRDFVYWLQGFFEITEAGGKTEGLSPEQVSVIKRHLNLVFAHEIDPSYGSKGHQEDLNKIHDDVAKKEISGGIYVKGTDSHPEGFDGRLIRC